MSASRFVNWVRAAAANSNDVVVNAAGKSVTVPVSSYGPGDVIGLNPGQIRFRSPGPGSVGMPPNFFPYIEFTQPDLPWCVTPGAPDAQGHLTPWLALIVLEAPGTASPLGQAAAGKLPVIEVEGNQLPPQSELALWAHAQIAGDGAQTEDLLRQGFARILSPRALAPLTHYVACLVPVFEAGRVAGLGGDPPDPLSTAPAWTSSADKIQLPVYDSWFFSTAGSGDFETLIRKLRGRDISSGSRPLQVDVSAVAGTAQGNVAPFDGALRPLGASADNAAAWSGPAAQASGTTLSGWLKREAASGPPVVGPPVYGSIQTGQSQPVPGWMTGLNYDPRYRAAAGLGAAMVRAHQDELIDEAWQQAGDLQRARREHAGAVLADLATARLHARYVAPLTGPQALLTLAPATPAMRDTAAPTVAARIAGSALPAAAMTPAFRRLLRTKTAPALRRAGQTISKTLPLLNAVKVVPGAPPPVPVNLVTKQQIEESMKPPVTGDPPVKPAGTAGSLEHAAPAPDAADLTIPAEGLETAGVKHMGAGDATSATTAATGTTSTTNTAGTHISTVLQLTASQTAILTQAAGALDAQEPAVVQVTAPQPFAWVTPAAPLVTAMMRFSLRADLGDRARLRGGAGPVTAPRFSEPLANWLDPAFLLAGVQIPADTAGLLEVNAPFVEAVLVGANHELARELLWRGVTLDRSATLLTRFFDLQDAANPKDVPAISTWPSADALGTHTASGAMAVLVLRSRLVGQLSQAAIYLAQAVMNGNYRAPGPVQLLPVFRGVAGTDTAYFGFEIPPGKIAGSANDPGYYFTIQQREGSATFGFDEQASGPLNTWDDLAWPLVAAPNGYVAAGQKSPAPASPGTLRWGTSGAQMAAICFQKPLRISIHGSLLIPAS